MTDLTLSPKCNYIFRNPFLFLVSHVHYFDRGNCSVYIIQFCFFTSPLSIVSKTFPPPHSLYVPCLKSELQLQRMFHGYIFICTFLSLSKKYLRITQLKALHITVLNQSQKKDEPCQSRGEVTEKAILKKVSFCKSTLTLLLSFLTAKTKGEIGMIIGYLFPNQRNCTSSRERDIFGTLSVPRAFPFQENNVVDDDVVSISFMENTENFFVYWDLNQQPPQSQRFGVKSHCVKAFLWGAA